MLGVPNSAYNILNTGDCNGQNIPLMVSQLTLGNHLYPKHGASSVKTNVYSHGVAGKNRTTTPE